MHPKAGRPENLENVPVIAKAQAMDTTPPTQGTPWGLYTHMIASGVDPQTAWAAALVCSETELSDSTSSTPPWTLFQSMLDFGMDPRRAWIAALKTHGLSEAEATHAAGVLIPIAEHTGAAPVTPPAMPQGPVLELKAKSPPGKAKSPTPASAGGTATVPQGQEEASPPGHSEGGRQGQGR